MECTAQFVDCYLQTELTVVLDTNKIKETHTKPPLRYGSLISLLRECSVQTTQPEAVDGNTLSHRLLRKSSVAKRQASRQVNNETNYKNKR